MLSGMTGFPIAIGWVMHFMIGAIFALSYSVLVRDRVRLSNLALKGAIVGFAVFVFAQIAMAMMKALLGPMPAPEGGMLLLVLGSIMGHLIYGIVVAFVAKPTPSGK